MFKSNSIKAKSIGGNVFQGSKVEINAPDIAIDMMKDRPDLLMANMNAIARALEHSSMIPEGYEVEWFCHMERQKPDAIP